ncbi:MAG: hypothetical protein ACRDF4_10085 [Rhabdochlamydiaceae bacterium]
MASDRQKFDSVIEYKISDLMLCASIEEICRQSGSELKKTASTEEIEEELVGSGQLHVLIICDMVAITEQLEPVMKFAKSKGYEVLGYYPHVNRQIETLGRSLGVNYVTPRSALRARLRSLLT